ncbi:hypothetical protein [Streptomyces sp. W007]|uniref:hypothetical protein n=1 Tax=Streptomyces sp. W007 TaxID=1055352 RepID=UPI0002FACF0A|nr:hypothetical protein [Streptomyces sp. W007]
MNISVNYPETGYYRPGDGAHMLSYSQPRAGYDGTFSSLFRLRRARQEREARQASRAREHRLLQLSRDIEALEAWHHAWRLEWDVDYRELHPGEWCAHHGKVRVECSCDYLAYGRRRRIRHVEPYEVTTWSGHVIRGPGPAQHTTSALTVEERRAATRTMAKWGSEG